MGGGEVECNPLYLWRKSNILGTQFFIWFNRGEKEIFSNYVERKGTTTHNYVTYELGLYDFWEF